MAGRLQRGYNEVASSLSNMAGGGLVESKDFGFGKRKKKPAPGTGEEASVSGLDPSLTPELAAMLHKKVKANG